MTDDDSQRHEAPKIGDRQLRRLVEGKPDDPANPGEVSPRGKPIDGHPEGLPDTVK